MTMTLRATGMILSLAILGGAAHAKGRGMDFETLDADGNGSITQAEFDAAHAARFAAADADSDGALTSEELIAHISAQRDGGRERRIARMAERMIDRFDTDENGSISAEEFAATSRSEHMIERLDEDGNGEISASEAEAAKGKRGKHGKRRGRQGDRG